LIVGESVVGDAEVGIRVGTGVGNAVGEGVGFRLGDNVGCAVGANVGAEVGVLLGVGKLVGFGEGRLVVGITVGAGVVAMHRSRPFGFPAPTACELKKALMIA
jgi:hypothetical protein